MNDTDYQMHLKRLKYRANHRGTKEMDIILGNFANECLEKLVKTEIDAFELLMDENDCDLLVWFTGGVEFPHDNLKLIFCKIENHLQHKAEHD